MIEGNVISLKPIDELDTDNIVRWRNSKNVLENFFIQKKITKEDHLWWLNNRVKTKEVYQFIIIEKSKNTPIGTVFLRDVDLQNNKAEFGIFIGEDSFRGRGIGSEAAKLICDYGFESLGLNKIFLRVFYHNTKAIRSYEKVGFIREGILKADIRVDNKYYDTIIMSMFR